MKEIIYIQAGRNSNYAGTHFWNTQESYFTYDEGTESAVEHDVSFREGISSQNEQTYCPRALIFDFKSNFGALSRHNDLYTGELGSTTRSDTTLWNGSTVEYRQTPISKSDYQRQLEDEQYDASNEKDGNNDQTHTDPVIRYWSDYNRVYYVPRSIQQVPELPDWEAHKGNWSYGKEIFERYASDTNLMDDALRHFAEECDNLQGFQTTFDNDSFGGFTTAFLEAIHDEYPKQSNLVFPELSGINLANVHVDIDDVPRRKACLQDVLSLLALADLGAQIVPVQNAAASWPPSQNATTWLKHLSFDKNNIYHTSAIVSALIESATLPLRLKNNREALSTLCAQLNWAQNTPIAHLSGALPLDSVVDAFNNNINIDAENAASRIKDALYDFSTCIEQVSNSSTGGLRTNGNAGPGQYLAHRATLRGLVPTDVTARAISSYFTEMTGLEQPYATFTYAPAYPLPNSYPSIFSSPTPSRPRTTTLLSTLSTSHTNTPSLRAYASFLSKYAKHTSLSSLSSYSASMEGSEDGIGMGRDALKEMAERMWTLVDAYADLNTGEETETGSEGSDGVSDGDDSE